jgi:hypothetical protein
MLAKSLLKINRIKTGHRFVKVATPFAVQNHPSLDSTFDLEVEEFNDELKTVFGEPLVDADVKYSPGTQVENSSLTSSNGFNIRANVDGKDENGEESSSIHIHNHFHFRETPSKEVKIHLTISWDKK